MVLMATDLPEPVVPAINKCGMRARSTMMDSPPIFLPRQSGSFATDSLPSLTASNSRRWTFSRCGFGNSMPMALRPGTTATRADSALIERAMSSASPMTRDDLMPGAGSSSYSVTTGPGCLDDFTADAEIAEHAFQRARVGIEIGFAERLAIRSPRRGKHGNRRQLEFVG